MKHTGPQYRRRLYAQLMLISLILGLAGYWTSAVAHHAFAEFDLSEQRTIRGTVVAFEWTHPHVLARIAVDSADGGRIIWQLEGMSPAYLGRRGWARNTLSEGATVELDYYPLKRGDPGGMLIRARLADGTVKVMINEPGVADDD